MHRYMYVQLTNVMPVWKTKEMQLSSMFISFNENIKAKV